MRTGRGGGLPGRVGRVLHLARGWTKNSRRPRAAAVPSTTSPGVSAGPQTGVRRTKTGVCRTIGGRRRARADAAFFPRGPDLDGVEALI